MMVATTAAFNGCSSLANVSNSSALDVHPCSSSTLLMHTNMSLDWRPGMSGNNNNSAKKRRKLMSQHERSFFNDLVTSDEETTTNTNTNTNNPGNESNDDADDEELNDSASCVNRLSRSKVVSRIICFFN